jgi:hypothetical protein
MKKQWKLYGTIAGLIALLLFTSWKWYQKSGEVVQWKHNYGVLQLEHRTYVSETDGNIVSYQQALLLTEEQLKNAMWGDSIHREMANRYKKLAERVQITTEFVHDTILVYIPGTDSIQSDTIIPYSNACLSADFSLSNGFMTMDNLFVQNQQDIVLGLRKNGLRRSYWAVDVRNSNPCIQVTGLQATHVVKKKRWWENPLITGGIGILVGVIGWETIR